MWVPASHTGDQDKIHTYWLQPGPGLTFVDIWGVIQQSSGWYKTYALFLPFK